MLFSSISMHFFIKFHGQLRFLVQAKKGTVAHAEIEGFSMYRDRYMRKMPPYSRTYAVVLKTVAYEAMHKVFQAI